MIDFKEFVLDNGLRVFVHEDDSSKTAVVNILYNVGSRDENPEKTGFAHLFEHLMFGGSANINSFDEPLQKVGGENNAFTSPDITNYYVTLPSNNLETAFWLESDRMMSLSFNPEVLEVQRKVVIEEFKQRYLNQPYGDVWLRLRPLAYKTHPYRWATIGKDISHIEGATMEDVKSFFYKFYRPNNAIMVVAGGVKLEQVKKLAEKWFGPIPAGENYQRNLPQESEQKEARVEHVEAAVPMPAIYKTFHMPGRLNKTFHTADLISDMLGRGKSSHLYQLLVKKEKIFNSLQAYVTSSADPGLLCVSGKVNDGIDPEEANKALEMAIEELPKKIDAYTLEKVKHQAESTVLYSEVDVLNRAMSIAYGAFLGRPNLINEETDTINAVTLEEVQKTIPGILRKDNCSTLFYHPTNGNAH